jgi:GT2 family glycosyltransferase
MIGKALDLSIIIVNWNTKQLLLDCIASIYGTVKRSSFEIIVVDNASSDDSVKSVSRAYPDVRTIVNTKNLGFSKANNLALKQMQGRYAVILNSDTILKDSVFDDMMLFMENNPDVGICGPQLLNSDDSVQRSIGDFPVLLTEFMSKRLVRLLFPKTYNRAFHTRKTVFQKKSKVDVILGACMMVRKRAIESTGVMDEEYFFFYEETDWCYRMHNNGWRIYYLPEVKIYHLGGQSRKEINLRARAESWRSRYLFYKKNLHLSSWSWYGLILLGFLQTTYQFLVYTVLNMTTFYSVKRLRRRWNMFAYLLVWHLKGRPISMGIPR